MAGYDVLFLNSEQYEGAVADIVAAFSVFADKTGFPFYPPERDGDFAALVTRDDQPIALASFTGRYPVVPMFHEKCVHIQSALSLGNLDKSDVDFITCLYDSVQDLIFGERCSIVFTTTRAGWLKRAKAFGFHYTGMLRPEGLFCFERR